MRIVFFIALLGLLLVNSCKNDPHIPIEVDQPTRYLDTIFDNIHIDTNFIYGTKQHIHWAWVFQPKGDRKQNRPVVVLLPGGGFEPDQIGHSFNLLKPLATELAHKGYVAILMNYTTRHRINDWEYRINYMTALHDLKTMLHCLTKQTDVARVLGINPDQVATIGWSAGAQIGLNNAYVQENQMTKLEEFTYKTVNSDNAAIPFDFPIKAHISMAGNLSDLSRIDFNDPPLMCLHSDTDFTIRIDSQASPFGISYGSMPLIHRVSQLGIPNHLWVIENGTHTAPMKALDCPKCNQEIIRFLYLHLIEE